MKGDPGTFAENSCRFFGSDSLKGWQCPTSYPIYSGATMGGHGNKMFCSGGVAKNATCNGSSGTGARAKTYVDGGKITDVKVVRSGQNYKFPPHARVLGGGGYGAILKTEISGGVVDRVIIVDGGQDYQSPPEIQFETVDGGYGATAEALIDGSRVVAINMVNTGQNYQISPNISLRGGGGSGATAIADINNGHVISIRITNNGSAYTYPPTVVITPNSAKAGCNYCHMCCKRGPKNNTRKYRRMQRQYERRIN